MAVFYVLCDDDCRYEGMTKQQVLTAIQEAVEQGYVSDPDGAVFSKIKEINAGAAMQLWVGTEAQFNALSPVPDVSAALVRVAADGKMYLFTDDTYIEGLAAEQTVDPRGTSPVSGAAVASYVATQIAAIADYDGEAF